MSKRKKIKPALFDKGKNVSARDDFELPSEQQHPVFALQYMDKDKNFSITYCEKDDKASFTNTLYKLSQLTWLELKNRPRHKLGYEKISRDQIKRPLPDVLKESERIIAFRFRGKKAMAGYRRGKIFYILWVDPKFKLYDHS